jgi:aldose 1-epimerase
MQKMPELQLLRSGALRASVAPHIGGSLASFYSVSDQAGERHDWLRPASEAHLAQGNAFEMASFPLVPWANRIRDGRFTFDGCEVQLPPNRGDDPHTIHGIGWMQAWEVTARSESQIDLCMNYDGKGSWPYAFSSVQSYALDPQGLSISLTVTNQGAVAMPAGIGHHPYFPHDTSGAGTRVTAQVQGIWESDASVLPRKLTHAHPVVDALKAGMLLRDFDLDNNFTGFEGLAQVDWPHGDSLRMSASDSLNCFVVYCPGGKNIFCIEAVSNCTDWLNLRTPQEHAKGLGALEQMAGGHVLLPGETLQGSLRLEPRVAKAL